MIEMKKGQIIFLVVIAIAAVIPVLVVFGIYYKYGFCKIEEIWYEDSLIDYWGVIIGAAPTVVFAALTYRQTEKNLSHAGFVDKGKHKAAFLYN